MRLASAVASIIMGLRPLMSVTALPATNIPTGGRIAFSKPPLGACSLSSIFSYLNVTSGSCKFNLGERRYSGKSCGFSSLRCCGKKNLGLKIMSFEKVVTFHWSGRLSNIKSGVKIVSPTLNSQDILCVILSSL